MANITKHIQPSGGIERATAEYLAGVLSNQTKPTLLLLSGGQALRLLFYLEDARLPEFLSIGMLGDRYGDQATESSFLQFAETPFYNKAIDHGATFIESFLDEGSSVRELGDEIDETIKDWKDFNSDGVVIAVINVDTDGHIAGIIPHPNEEDEYGKLFGDPRRWAVGYDTKGKSEFKEIMTVTNTFLRNVVDLAIVYSVGADKQRALKSIFESDADAHKVPARMLHHMKEVHLFTDQDI